MASYPSQKAHRVSRRKLGRGQSNPALGTTVALTTTGTTNLTMTFARPVTVSGVIPVTSAGLTIVSQTVVSSTVVTQVWSASIAAASVVFPSNAANVTTYQGGGVAGTSVTF
jgi:hypothetical protein